LAATAEGAWAAITSNLQRMRELAVQGANGTNTTDDVNSLDEEYTLLVAENLRISTATKFNDTAVIAATPFTFQIGANNDAGNDQISVTGLALTQTATTLGGTTALAFAEISKIDTEIDLATTARATWGANQNRFQTVINNLRVGAENSAAARGRIVDADYAQETANLTRAQVLQQAGTAMVAQANQGPNGVLALLR
jgi:flagellin